MANLSISIYPRKFLFFSMIAIVAFVVYNTTGNIANADNFAQFAEGQNMASDEFGSYRTSLSLTSDGNLEYASGKINNVIKIRSDREELRHIVLNAPQNYYQSATITLFLPKPVDSYVDEPEIIAVHGAEPGLVKAERDKIIFTANNVMAEQPTVTIVAGFPKGYFNLSGKEKVAGFINSVPGNIWLAGGLIIPPIALALLILMFFRSSYQTNKRKVEGEISKPPSRMHPSLVSALFYGRVGPRAIMADLIALAEAGYVQIYSRDDDFYLYRGSKTTEKLTNFEKILLEKIFLPKQVKVDAMDVEDRMARHIFSRKISLVYLNIYYQLSNQGIFSDSPAFVHLKYRLVGIGTFFLGFLGYIYSAVTAADPKFILFMWLALAIFGLLIVELAPKLTPFTKKGQSVRDEWVKFRNFLTLKEPIKDESLFDKYLPYALAMGCEVEWASRFALTYFKMPDWYDSQSRIGGLVPFAQSMLPIIEFIAKSLNVSSDPLVK